MRAFAAICLAALAALAGCGDSDDPEPTTISVTTTLSATTSAGASEDEAPVPPDDSAGNPEAADDPGADRPRTVEDVVAAVLTGSETPELICDQLVTPGYVQAAYGARQGCLAAQQPGSLAKSVEVEDVQESGGSATAVAVPSGGPYDGVDVEVELVSATDLEGAWAIDSLLADVPAGP